jgi:multicomponent Na+:H+ antiporter subunit G
MIGELLVLFGSLLVLLSATGMVRFTNVFTRMHALSKASTAGMVVVVVGGAVHLHHPNDVTSLILAGALQLMTGPVAANMVSVATYQAEGIGVDVAVVDELAADPSAPER